MRKPQILPKQQLYDTKTGCERVARGRKLLRKLGAGTHGAEYRVAMLRKLANLFNVSIDELLNGD